MNMTICRQFPHFLSVRIIPQRRGKCKSAFQNFVYLILDAAQCIGYNKHNIIYSIERGIKMVFLSRKASDPALGKEPDT